MFITRTLCLLTLLLSVGTLKSETLTGVFKDVPPENHGALVEKSKSEAVLVLYYLPDCHICHNVEEKLAELAIERELHPRVFTVDATHFDDPEIEVLPVIRVYERGDLVISRKGRTLSLQVKSLLGKLND